MLHTTLTLNTVWRPSLIMSQASGYTVLALASGTLTAFAFAPFNVFVLALTGPLCCWWLWERDSAAAAFWHGWLYTLALLSVGGYWLYLTPKELGNVDTPLAELLTGVFVSVMSIYMGVAGSIYVWLRQHFSFMARALVLLPALWVFGEWWRGWFMTGFPWFSLGYASLETPLAGWVPIFGVYGVSLGFAMTAGAVAVLGGAASRCAPREGRIAIFTLLILWGGGALLSQVAWSQPAGDPIKVALIQLGTWGKGLADQDRWQQHIPTAQQLLPYHDLIVWAETVEDVYLVETAGETTDAYVAADRILSKEIWRSRSLRLNEDLRHFAIAYHHEEQLLRPLERAAQAQNKAMLLGLALNDNQRGLSYNSIMALGDETAAVYDKRHLVPFGEVFPLRETMSWFWEWLGIHKSTYHWSRTANNLLTVNGYTVGVSICYESAFGHELADALPAAQFMVMVSSDAMFDGTHELEQHQHIARLRALETGRWIARVTATGVTAIINPQGQEAARLPVGLNDVLSGSVLPMSGLTPYGYWRNWPVLGFIVLVVMVGVGMNWHYLSKM